MARTRYSRGYSYWARVNNNYDSHSWRKTKKEKKKKKKSRENSFLKKSAAYLSDLDMNFVGGYVFGMPDRFDDEPLIIEEIPHDDLDDEIMIGTVKTFIVGVQYYKGTVNNGEMVCAEREPKNAYDRNAIRVLNLDRVQVGHIKRELAKPLAFVLDGDLARLEGVVPMGSGNVYQMSLELTLWGKPDNKQRVVDILKSHGVMINVSTMTSTTVTASTSSRNTYNYNQVVTNRQFLSPGEVKDELDKLFESLHEGDKTTMTDPSSALKSPLYPHQSQALHWMIGRENGKNLPPFWQKQDDLYYNSVTCSSSPNKPDSVNGGILADDMGLGKTLEMIALILTNFVNNEPLAQPVFGRIRQSKQKVERSYNRKSSNRTATTSEQKLVSKSMLGIEDSGCPFDRVRSLEAQIERALDNEKENAESYLEESSKSCVDVCAPQTGSGSILGSKLLQFKEAERTDALSVALKVANVQKTTFNAEKFLQKLASLDNGSSEKDCVVVNSCDEDGSQEMELIVNGSDSVMVLSSEEEEMEEEIEEEEDDNAPDCEIDGNVMLQKEDKDFQPPVEVTPEAIPSRSSRPRRSAKRPARYTFDDDDDDVDCRPVKIIVEPTVVAIKSVRVPTTTSTVEKTVVLEPTVLAAKSVRVPTTTSTVSIVEQAVRVEPTVLAVNSVIGPSTTSTVDVEPTLIAVKSVNVPTTPSAVSIIENVVVEPTVLAVKSLNVQSTTSTVSTAEKVGSRGRGRGKGVSCGRGKGKGKAKVSKRAEVIPDLPQLEQCPETSYPVPEVGRDELPDLSQDSNDKYYAPCGDSESSDDEDDLPDLAIPFDCNKAGVSNCDVSTGRTFCDGPRTTLIVCPLSVMSNWVDQFEEHLKDNVHLEIYTYYGPNRNKNINVLKNQDVVITTYMTLSNDAKTPQKPLQKMHWLRVVLDEGHMIRNPSCQSTKAIIDLTADRRWVITGTPIQNSIKDLWSLMNFLKVHPFTDKVWWHRTIERPLKNGNVCAIKRVQHLMGCIALRRTKTTKVNDKPLVDLPARLVFVESIELSKEERKVYTAMQNEGKMVISKYFQEGTLLKNFGHVLAILMRLRQMCCHPTLVARAAASNKESRAFLETMQDKMGSISNEDKEKLVSTLLMVLNSGSDEECCVCLDSIKHAVITSCAHVFCRNCIVAVINNEKPDSKCPLCRGPIDEQQLIEVPPEIQVDEVEEVNTFDISDWQSSAKVDAMMKSLLKLRESEPTTKSLVVSQFTSFLNLLEIPLTANGFRFARLDGTMTVRKRTDAIHRFSEIGPGTPTIFLLSLKAGGVGLNLTAANRVFLMDPAWNPASEEQCFDRCHRLGQKKDVIITKFFVVDSVEERMQKLQDKKRLLMQGAFGQKQTAEQRRQGRITDIKNLMNL